MVERLLHNWHGYVKLRLHGYSPERFLNLCNARKLEIWGILCKDGDYEFFMTVPGYRKVKPLVRKSRVRLRIPFLFVPEPETQIVRSRSGRLFCVFVCDEPVCMGYRV